MSEYRQIKGSDTVDGQQILDMSAAVKKHEEQIARLAHYVDTLQSAVLLLMKTKEDNK